MFASISGRKAGSGTAILPPKFLSLTSLCCFVLRDPVGYQKCKSKIVLHNGTRNCRYLAAVGRPFKAIDGSVRPLAAESDRMLSRIDATGVEIEKLDALVIRLSLVQLASM
jgi:hypothetical protein